MADDPRAGVWRIDRPDKLDRLGRYEVHLNRKLDRMLRMQVGPKKLRRNIDAE
jgi:hypothetical protein